MVARRCCVPGCGYRKIGFERIMLHQIPRRNPFLTETWLQKIQRMDLLDDISRLPYYVVCDQHFSQKQRFKATRKNKTNLIYEAVPDQKLPLMTEEGSTSVVEEATSAEDLSALIKEEDMEIVTIFPEDVTSEENTTPVEEPVQYVHVRKKEEET